MSEARPKISVIIPAYQHGPELPLCLNSIFVQDFNDFEVIVVDDGSTDDTVERLRPYLNRITLIRQENRGGNAARNRGFDASRGEFVIFCDADVIMRPDMLSKMLATLDAHPEAAYAYSSFRYGWKKFRLWPFDEARLRQMNFVHTTSLMRRAAFPRFDEVIRRFQDWDLWLTMLEWGRRGVFIPEYLFKCLPHMGGISSWLPGFFFLIPWEKIGWRVMSVEKYREAERVIRKKHFGSAEGL